MGRSRKGNESGSGQNADWAEVAKGAMKAVEAVADSHKASANSHKASADSHKASADSYKTSFIVLGTVVVLCMLVFANYKISGGHFGMWFKGEPSLKISEPIVSANPKNIDPVKPVTETEAEVVVDKYLDSWRNKDFFGRISYLSQDFTSTNYDVCTGNQSGSHIPYGNPENLQVYKEQVLENIRNPDNITVDKLSPFEYGIDQGGVYVAYRQRYEQSSYESLGINKFHLRKNRNNEIEIYKEIFYRESCPGKDCKRRC